MANRFPNDCICGLLVYAFRALAADVRLQVYRPDGILAT